MKKLLTLLFVAALITTINAQMHGGDGHNNPDSLQSINVSGTAIVDDSLPHAMYYLDTDNDGNEDYKLNFGPYWYQPDSSNAVRPQNGEQVTIEGGLHESFNNDLNTIVVYEINGEFWRDPYFAFWNDFGGHNNGGGHHQGGCTGYAFGWDHDSLENVTVAGTALVDTTFFMNHYYLDTDNDTIPDYFLNFGPWWYEPASGAERPSNGDQVTITGSLIEGVNFDKIIVYEINGLEWRDSTNFSGHMGGGWIHKNMASQVTFHNPYDNDDFFEVNPGWNQGGHHGGGMMSDSLFCQILELYPNDIPNSENEDHFMGFELGIFNPNGTNNMWNSGSCGGHMSFGSDVSYQIHYNDIQVLGNNIDENSIEAKYWDDQSSSWMAFNSASVNAETNIVTFSGSEVSNFVILTADKITSVENGENGLPTEFSLKQNYPNPFNPSTTIEFSLNEVNPVELNIYNALGQKITTLISKTMESGNYKYQFDAGSLASGIYFYELKVGNLNSVKKMNLLK